MKESCTLHAPDHITVLDAWNMSPVGRRALVRAKMKAVQEKTRRITSALTMMKPTSLLKAAGGGGGFGGGCSEPSGLPARAPAAGSGAAAALAAKAAAAGVAQQPASSEGTPSSPMAAVLKRRMSSHAIAVRWSFQALATPLRVAALHACSPPCELDLGDARARWKGG